MKGRRVSLTPLGKQVLVGTYLHLKCVRNLIILKFAIKKLPNN
jgi:hypothetical protein